MCFKSTSDVFEKSKVPFVWDLSFFNMSPEDELIF